MTEMMPVAMGMVEQMVGGLMVLLGSSDHASIIMPTVPSAMVVHRPMTAALVQTACDYLNESAAKP